MTKEEKQNSKSKDLDPGHVDPTTENKSTLFFFIGTGIGVIVLIILVALYSFLGGISGDENMEEVTEEVGAQEEVEEPESIEEDIVDETTEPEVVAEEIDEVDIGEVTEGNEDSTAKEYMSKKTIKSLVDDMDEIYWVVSIIDGDTLVVADQDNNEFQVRVLAVDTNEVNGKDSTAECYGYEATMFTAALLKDRAVRLRADQNNRDEDDYGRKLRFVDALQPDGAFISLSVALLTNGYAVYPDEYPLTTPDYYEYLEQEARDQGKGMWSACF